MSFKILYAKNLLAKFISQLVYPLENAIFEIFHNEYTILTTSVKPFKHNWGDDVSIVLARLINPDQHFIVNRYSWNIKKKDNILCIGSIISWMTTHNSIIWGSGVVYPDHPISAIPKKILAVRGPLTREYLLKQNINCPEIYGDPALLFPQYYSPPKIKKYKIGIIPHFRDKNNQIWEKFKKDHDVFIIDVQNVYPWSQFIDDICSCEKLLTSSLHGLIIADSYSIPNVWIELESGESKRFAFLDYLKSVNKDEIKAPIVINDDTNLYDVLKITELWRQGTIDLEPLIKVCPFK